MVKSSILAAIAAAALLATASFAQAGNYSTGVQIGSAPTAAQQAFNEEQMRIRYDGDFLHESEHRNGGKLVIKVTKHIWYSMRDALRGTSNDWAPEDTAPADSYQ